MNAYETPSELGLELVAEIDGSSGYDWDVLAVYRQKTNGHLYYYEDSGCSCDAPRFYNLEGLQLIDSYDTFAEHVMNRNETMTEKVDFLWKVGQAWRSPVSGECDHCGEHCLECRCHSNKIDWGKFWAKSYSAFWLLVLGFFAGIVFRHYFGVCSCGG